MPVTRPGADEVQVFASAEDFRGWLEGHHDTDDHVWVGYYRKASGKTAMTYPESVDVALCFGWIDGIGYGIDHEIHTNRFTPRRKGSSWSAVNIAKVEEMTAAGQMHPAGLRAFEERDRRKDAQYSYEQAPMDLPAELEERLRRNESAWQHWRGQPPGYRRTAIHWILSAKRPETRERRFAELAEASAAARPIKPMAYGRNRSDA